MTSSPLVITGKPHLSYKTALELGVATEEMRIRWLAALARMGARQVLGGIPTASAP